jgi:hypothetical protein
LVGFHCLFRLSRVFLLGAQASRLPTFANPGISKVGRRDACAPSRSTMSQNSSLPCAVNWRVNVTSFLQIDGRRFSFSIKETKKAVRIDSTTGPLGFRARGTRLALRHPGKASSNFIDFSGNQATGVAAVTVQADGCIQGRAL